MSALTAKALESTEAAWRAAAARKAPVAEQAPLYAAFKAARSAHQSAQGTEAIARMRTIVEAGR